MPERSFAESGTKSVEGASGNLVPEGTSEAVESSVISFLREKLDITVQPGDIHAAHRLKKGDKDTIRPVIVRFSNSKLRDRVMRAKKSLKQSGTRIYILEHLTNTASKLFFNARTLVRNKKIFSTWTMNGRVYFKRTSSREEKPSLFTEAIVPK